MVAFTVFRLLFGAVGNGMAIFVSQRSDPDTVISNTVYLYL